MRNTVEKFWSQALTALTNNDCWEWQASCDQYGYGQFSYQGKLWKAHRLSWLLTYNNLPDGLSVCHTCDNPKCINPEHLFLGTQADNNRDMAAKGRIMSIGRPGERHPSAKLSDEIVLSIRELYQEGHKQADIARQFDVSQQTVSRIVNHKSWTHI